MVRDSARICAGVLTLRAYVGRLSQERELHRFRLRWGRRSRGPRGALDDAVPLGGGPYPGADGLLVVPRREGAAPGQFLVAVYQGGSALAEPRQVASPRVWAYAQQVPRGSPPAR